MRKPTTQNNKQMHILLESVLACNVEGWEGWKSKSLEVSRGAGAGKGSGQSCPDPVGQPQPHHYQHT